MVESVIPRDDRRLPQKEYPRWPVYGVIGTPKNMDRSLFRDLSVKPWPLLLRATGTIHATQVSGAKKGAAGETSYIKRELTFQESGRSNEGEHRSSTAAAELSSRKVRYP